MRRSLTRNVLLHRVDCNNASGFFPALKGVRLLHDFAHEAVMIH